MRRVGVVVVLAAAVTCIASAAGSAHNSRAAAPDGDLQVVAAEDFWGSIAQQLGGARVHVTSVITNPATDPHDYEPTAVDARTIASARMVIANGVGYDPWISKLVAANPIAGRAVLTVGELLGIKAGGNPHRWYSPGDVEQVIAGIIRDYTRLVPNDAIYFRAQKRNFETRGLRRYKRLMATIRHRYHGVTVGASESIFAPLAQALHLNLITPPTFLKAISEGTDPIAKDLTTIDRQIARRQIKVWVFNSQNSTPDVQRLTDTAHKRGIPVTTITETVTPAAASFQSWQSRQLQALAAALAQATGR